LTEFLVGCQQEKRGSRIGDRMGRLAAPICSADMTRFLHGLRTLGKK
jgi:hypothetical protein